MVNGGRWWGASFSRLRRDLGVDRDRRVPERRDAIALGRQARASSYLLEHFGPWSILLLLSRLSRLLGIYRNTRRDYHRQTTRGSTHVVGRYLLNESLINKRLRKGVRDCILEPIQVFE